MPGDRTRPPRADALRNRARILAAAEEAFAERGAAVSTEDVAARAGVAVGTVFRHFPTKRDLLVAIMKRLRERLAGEAGALLADGDPATALFVLFDRLVERAASTRSVAALLAGQGTPIDAGASLDGFADAVAALLDRAQRAGAVRPDARPDEVMALLSAACQGALAGEWDADLRRRTLALVFDGLRPR
ncbi:TetR/AcrR family transcriptional regulator [Actinomadura kijaniata]|uniref:TetR/AcrR family transcriptional regulator n=1 Tax=Actinomadura kijaniata TaxID=46161 RepID=UPI000829AAA9|nr:TetR/AcrR family transcriptional regulator [Actinomadura kijaniata]